VSHTTEKCKTDTVSVTQTEAMFQLPDRCKRVVCQFSPTLVGAAQV
jgi:hypothetical protein